ncbi:hypothetical protein WR25_03803 isoform D [Diploscapter pachys]|nr:hypothetical protein WR25_03803 isoform D [Diploscapter pachys]
MCFLWALSGLTTMSPSYLNARPSCGPEFVTVGDHFNITSGFLNEMTTSAFFFGNLCLGQVYSTMADRLGRRPIIVWSLIMSGLFGSLGALAPNYCLFLVSRFLQGSFFNALTVINWVMAIECLPIKSHATYSFILGLAWVLGYCAITPMALIWPHWRGMQLLTSIPALIFGVIILFTLPESISWLVVRGKESEVQKWINAANKSAKKKITVNAKQIIMENCSERDMEEESFMAQIKNLLRDKYTMLCVAMESILWIVDFMGYSQLSIAGTGIIKDNCHLGYIFTGVVEIVCYAILPIFLDKLGRKPTVMIVHFIGFLSLLGMFFTQRYADSNVAFLIVWLIAKFSFASAFMCCFVYGSEIFSTSCRSICVGICVTLSNLGAMASPHVSDLDSFTFPGFYLLVFAFCSILCILATIPLPETAHRVNGRKNSCSELSSVEYIKKTKL